MIRRSAGEPTKPRLGEDRRLPVPTWPMTVSQPCADQNLRDASRGIRHPKSRKASTRNFAYIQSRAASTSRSTSASFCRARTKPIRQSRASREPQPDRAELRRPAPPGGFVHQRRSDARTCSMKAQADARRAAHRMTAVDATPNDLSRPPVTLLPPIRTGRMRWQTTHVARASRNASFCPLLPRPISA